MTTADEALGIGWKYQQAGALSEAERVYREILQRSPRHPDVWLLLGTVCLRQGKLREAVAGLEEAVRFQPERADAHSNLGVALARQGKPRGGACRASAQALRIKPDYAEAQTNLGNALRELGRLEEALEAYDRALRLAPEDAEVHNNRGLVLDRQGKREEALACFEQALRLVPDHPYAHKNRAALWLARGDYERGWPELEWRWRCGRDFILPPHSQPLWAGASLEGRTILLHTEQGFGDTLQFIRYAPLVAGRGRCCVVRPLSASPGPAPGELSGDRPRRRRRRPAHCTGLRCPCPADELAERPEDEVGHRPGADPLPRRRPGTRRVLAPAAGADRRDQDRHRLAGQPQESGRSHAFLPTVTLRERLARVEGVRLISLQKGLGAEQLRAAAVRFPVVDFGDALDPGPDAFLDTAAVMKHLDLVITLDSAVAHLAGALGVPVWIALHFPADCRWLLGRADSPWYPTARLFRQDRDRSWGPVFERVAEVLSASTGFPARRQE